MARTAGFDDDLPAVMISKNDGAALRAANPPDASALATFQELVTPNQDILAGFSSQGPTLVDFAVKPDVTSVGVNVLALSRVCSAQENSHAPPRVTVPMLLGLSSAAHPWQRRASPGRRLCCCNCTATGRRRKLSRRSSNRADLVIKDAITGTHDVGPTAQGGGRENLSVAADATTWMDPVSASFGRVECWSWEFKDYDPRCTIRLRLRRHSLSQSSNSLRVPSGTRCFWPTMPELSLRAMIGSVSQLA